MHDGSVGVPKALQMAIQCTRVTRKGLAESGRTPTPVSHPTTVLAMKITTVVLLAAFAFCLVQTIRLGYAYTRLLKAKGHEGLLGFDLEASSRYAADPRKMISESAFTKGWATAFRPTADEELEGARRPYRAWLIATIACFLLVLVSF